MQNLNMDIVLADSDALLQAFTKKSASGMLYQAIEHHFDSGGKKLRMRLAIDSLFAFGGDMECAPAWSASCELLHNATLVHDDLQDGDTHRRGRPTVWTAFGKNEAINVGDFMLMLAIHAVKELPKHVPDALRWKLTEALTRSTLNTIQGQSGELELSKYIGSADLRARYFECIDQKTSSLFELPVLGAALISKLSSDECTALSHAIRPLGSLFQIQDDVLDIFGDKGRDKPGADIREGKMSSLVVEHMTLHPLETAKLFEVIKLSREKTSDEDVRFWTTRFAEGGALAAAISEIEARTAELKNSLVIKEYPHLRAAIVNLLNMILKPIGHLQFRSEELLERGS